MTRSLLALLVACLCALRPVMAGATPLPPDLSRSGADEKLPNALTDVGIEERAGAKLPLEMELTDQEGKKVRLGDYFDGKPVVLVLAYYECPMLCTLVLNGLKQGMSGLEFNPGSDYRAIALSFDPHDTADLARAKRESYVKSFGRPVGPRGWDFLVGEEKAVRAVADAVGFRYRWDPATNQFAHAAGAFVFTKDGRLSRTLYGVTFPSRDLRLALTDASEGKLGAALDRVMLFCYRYDTNARSYVISPTQILKVVGLATMVALGAFLALLWRRETRRHANSQGHLHAPREDWS